MAKQQRVRGAKNVRLPVELAETLSARAEAIGLTLPRYMQLLSGRFDDVDLLVLEALRAAAAKQIEERKARSGAAADAAPRPSSAVPDSPESSSGRGAQSSATASGRRPDAPASGSPPSRAGAERQESAPAAASSTSEPPRAAAAGRPPTPGSPASSSPSSAPRSSAPPGGAPRRAAAPQHAARS